MREVFLAALVAFLFLSENSFAWRSPTPWESRAYLLDATDIFKGTVLSVEYVREKCEPNSDNEGGVLVTPPSPDFREYAKRISLTFSVERTYKGIAEDKFVYEAGARCDPKKGGNIPVGEVQPFSRWRIFKKGEQVYVFARRQKQGGYSASFVQRENWPSTKPGDYDEFKKMTDRLADVDKKFREAGPERKEQALRDIVAVLEEYQDYDSLAQMYEDRMVEKFEKRQPKDKDPQKIFCNEYPAKDGVPPFLGEDAEDYADFLPVVSDDLFNYAAYSSRRESVDVARRALCLVAHYADTPAVRDKALEMLKLPAR